MPVAELAKHSSLLRQGTGTEAERIARREVIRRKAGCSREDVPVHDAGQDDENVASPGVSAA